MDRETLTDIVNGAISGERSPAEIRTHLLMNTQAQMSHATVRAAIETFLAVGWKWEKQSGAAPMDVDAMTRKGKGKDGKGEDKDQILSR